MFSWREYPRAEYGGCVVKSKFVDPMQFDVNIQNIGIWFRERFISQEHANQEDRKCRFLSNLSSSLAREQTFYRPKKKKKVSKEFAEKNQF